MEGRKSKLVLFGISCMLVAGMLFSFGLTTNAYADENEEQVESAELSSSYPSGWANLEVLYNQWSDEEFYTINKTEANNLAKAGWRRISNDFPTSIVLSKGKYPVYRLYNKYSGEHFFTMNSSEKNNLTKCGWTYEGIGWYTFTDSKKSGANVYRMYNSKTGKHCFVGNVGTYNNLTHKGWKQEGVAFSVYCGD